MKKLFIVLLILLSVVAIFSACGGKGGNSKVNNDISGKTFVWEKPGFGGDFTITLQKDGKYQYYVGFLSSYIGMGTWTEENGIVTLTETSGYDNVFRFEVKDGGLSFIAEGSSKFMYVTVEDGDIFLPKDGLSSDPPEETTPRQESYTQISQEEAKEMMKKDDGHVIVDVRRQDEYDEGHIPGAILIPNESIGTEKPEELPDLDQIILVYCRSGRRSKEAAQKLFDIGYTHVYEFGGIIDWTGEIVKDEIMEPVRNTCVLVIEVGEKLFYANLADNPSAKALIVPALPWRPTMFMSEASARETMSFTAVITVHGMLSPPKRYGSCTPRSPAWPKSFIASAIPGVYVTEPSSFSMLPVTSVASAVGAMRFPVMSPATSSARR